MRAGLDSLRGRRALLVASSGGHLSEMAHLYPQLGISDDSLWVTADVPQAHSLLAGRNVLYVPYVAPRDIVGTLRVAALTMAAQRTYEAAVSTGAAMAVGVLPTMAAMGKPSVYIESFSRVTGPSLTGRLLEGVPRVGLFTAHQWARGPWRNGPSILSSYAVAGVDQPLRAPRRIFVTLGTIRPYRFDRLIDLVRGYVAEHPDTEVSWQVGSTHRADLPGTVHTEVGAAEFESLVHWADVVVSHAGLGISLNILESGKLPVLMARSHRFSEHVDDHQQQIVDLLVSEGLAVTAEQAFQDAAELARAASTRVVVSDPLGTESSELRPPDGAPGAQEGTAGSPDHPCDAA